jgi:hypothetical protein
MLASMAELGTSPLVSALSAIDVLGLKGRARWQATSAAMSAHFRSAAGPRAHEAPAELELAYGLLTKAAGVPIKRPTAAVALLQAVGLGQLKSGFSKLTSQRRLAAHPGANFLSDLSDALAAIPASELRSAAAEFRLVGRQRGRSASGSDTDLSLATSGTSDFGPEEELAQEQPVDMLAAWFAESGSCDDVARSSEGNGDAAGGTGKLQCFFVGDGSTEVATQTAAFDGVELATVSKRTIGVVTSEPPRASQGIQCDLSACADTVEGVAPALDGDVGPGGMMDSPVEAADEDAKGDDGMPRRGPWADEVDTEPGDDTADIVVGDIVGMQPGATHLLEEISPEHARLAQLAADCGYGGARVADILELRAWAKGREAVQKRWASDLTRLER